MMSKRIFLCADDGSVLRADKYSNGSAKNKSCHTVFVDYVDDSCIWQHEGNTLSCIATEQTVQVTNEPQSTPESTLILDGQRLTAKPAPQLMPSTHLAELHQSGFTVIPDVMDARARARFKAQAAAVRSRDFADEPPNDGFFWIRDGLNWSADLARATTHPLVLWLLRQYLTTADIHYCHLPVITTLKPAGALLNTYPDKGWHSDYPYHRGVFPNEAWPNSPALGAQFNICVDAFEAQNAATQFVPGSHTLGRVPDLSFNVGGTRMGVGQHADVAQMLAPAGAALLYDARMWHRACYELNTSGRDRIAILNAVAPAWVRPMMERQSLESNFTDSATAQQLSQRELREIEQLCMRKVQKTPEDMPHLQEKPSTRENKA